MASATGGLGHWAAWQPRRLKQLRRCVLAAEAVASHAAPVPTLDERRCQLCRMEVLRCGFGAAQMHWVVRVVSIPSEHNIPGKHRGIMGNHVKPPTWKETWGFLEIRRHVHYMQIQSKKWFWCEFVCSEPSGSLNCKAEILYNWIQFNIIIAVFTLIERPEKFWRL